jgi:Ca-activated chloride channel family protein
MYADRRARLVLAAFFFLMALLLANWYTPGVSAQGIIIDPPPIDPPIAPPSEPIPLMPPAITLDRHQVNAVIDGPLATVEVMQIFYNDTGVTVEGSYIFPLPADAAVSDFQMTIDGETLEGRLLDNDEARRIYEEIVRRQRDPALLEYLDRGLFQTSVFPIPAGEYRTLTLTYRQVLSQHNGLYEFVYPMRTQQYSATPVRSLAIAVELRNQPGLRTIYSPNLNISIERTGDDAALIGYEASNSQPEQDFSLFFGVDEDAIGLNVLSYKPAGEDGFFVLLAAPSIEVAEQEIVARDLVLVLDISGSMQGQKMDQARVAAHFLVDNLNEGDRFNLIAFSTGVRLWEGELQPVDDDSRAAAHDWIDTLQAGGSTDINRALLEGLGQLAGDDERPAYVLFLTDGLPTMGEVEAPRILANARNNRPDRTIRLFPFGVGFDVNTDLLDELSQEMGGLSSYVQPGEAIDEEVSEFYSQISTPVLVNVELDFGSTLVDEVYPYPLPDLFAGRQLVVVGRYRKGGTLTVRLRGEANGERMIFQYPGRTLVTSGGDPFVARLWATRKVGALLDQIRRSGPLQELVDEIVDLSLMYGIVTPYTSYLVIEPELMPAAGGADGSGAIAAYDLRADAAEEVGDTAAAVAAAPASGERAVAASETRNQLANAATVQETGGVRYVGGKTFVRQSLVTRSDGQSYELWVDTQYRAELELELVRFGSERYFELAAQSELAPWLAVSPELILVLDDGHAIRVAVE